MTFEDWYYDQFDRTREAAEAAWDYQQDRIDNLERWIAGIADDHPQIPDWIQQSARSLLAERIDELKRSSNKQIDNTTEVINGMRHKNPRYKRWLELNGFKEGE